MYLENINNFDLETSIIKVMNVYNNSIHHTTKHNPNEVFYNRNEAFLKEFHDNILESYKKYNKMETLFKINEKCLLINNILKTNQKTIQEYLILMKNKVKKKFHFLKYMQLY